MYKKKILKIIQTIKSTKIKTLKLILSSKAKTLQKISYINKKKINVPKFFFTNKLEIEKNKNQIISKVIKVFNKEKIIVRSSAGDEDGKNFSNAGKYDSSIIFKNDSKNINKSINSVCKKLTSNKDEIIFQTYIQNPEISGVVFTRDLNTNAPYYVINYDTSGKSDLVTSGKKNISQKTLNILKNLKKIPPKFKKLINTVSFLEKIFNEDRLDVEFAIKRNKVFIFQVRKLKDIKKINDKEFFSAIENIEKKLIKIFASNPTLYGKKNILSNMSDWNPAEMIGSKAKPLSISLYENLITDDIWSKQRSNYGYKNVSPNRLMIDLLGAPYIDLRTDLNSFLPKNLNSKISKKSINFFLKKIEKNTYLHDKIEFEVIPTCYELKKSNQLKFLNNLEKNHYLKELKKLTLNIISNKEYLDNDITNIYKLDEDIKNYKKYNNPIQKIFFLIHSCKKHGTLSFAGIARCAFISTKILRDLNALGLLSNEDINSFYSSIHTITRNFNLDLKKLKNKIITKKQFLKKYGHLRPSTYSISSKNYKDAFDKYFSKIKIEKNNYPKFKIDKSRKIKINKFLKKNYNLSFDKFFNFAKLSIKEREGSKFIFTKYINEVFDAIKKLSKEIKIKHNDFEYVSIHTLLNSYNNLKVNKLKNEIKYEIKENKKNYSISQMIKLPDVITSVKNIYFNYETLAKGNFVTLKKTKGNIKILNKNNIGKKIDNLKNLIIFIENADPGFDFIFSHKIKGLITKYGGANSHMSIRCMELNIPAIIGIGEKKYNYFSSFKEIEIDCENKFIKGL